MKNAACAWCGAEDQNLLEMPNGAIACEDWQACADREKTKNETITTPWGPRLAVSLPPPSRPTNMTAHLRY